MQSHHQWGAKEFFTAETKCAKFEMPGYPYRVSGTAREADRIKRQVDPTSRNRFATTRSYEVCARSQNARDRANGWAFTLITWVGMNPEQ